MVERNPHGLGRQEIVIPDIEVIEFREAAPDISEAILAEYGERVESKHGEVRIEHSWSVGGQHHKKFTVSRSGSRPLDDTTEYNLKFESLAHDGEDSNSYDYSKQEGLHPGFWSIPSGLEISIAQSKGVTIAEMHKEKVLKFLATKTGEDVGF